MSAKARRLSHRRQKNSWRGCGPGRWPSQWRGQLKHREIGYHPGVSMAAYLNGWLFGLANA